MAVASPVLERKVNTVENGYQEELYRDTFMTEDERHNARISSNYAKLINPESTLKDLIIKEPVHTEENYSAPEAQTESLYLVENARADADIFRADSAINRQTAEIVDLQADEEENEDLRPTQTTIQYKTAGVSKAAEEGKIKTSQRTQSRLTALTKKDKIVIAVALAVIVALFVLVIVNSAIISGLSNSVSTLQDDLKTAESLYDQSLTAKESYLDEDNLYQVVSDFAVKNGMVLR